MLRYTSKLFEPDDPHCLYIPPSKRSGLPGAVPASADASGSLSSSSQTPSFSHEGDDLFMDITGGSRPPSMPKRKAVFTLQRLTCMYHTSGKLLQLEARCTGAWLFGNKPACCLKYVLLHLAGTSSTAVLSGGGPEEKHDIDMVGLIDEELDEEEFLKLLREVGEPDCLEYCSNATRGRMVSS
jgi:hypothetical protein